MVNCLKKPSIVCRGFIRHPFAAIGIFSLIYGSSLGFAQSASGNGAPGAGGTKTPLTQAEKDDRVRRGLPASPDLVGTKKPTSEIIKSQRVFVCDETGKPQPKFIPTGTDGKAIDPAHQVLLSQTNASKVVCERPKPPAVKQGPAAAAPKPPVPTSVTPPRVPAAPQTEPAPAVVRQAPAPKLPTADSDDFHKIANEADNKARNYANVIVRRYGQIQRFRVSFQAGLAASYEKASGPQSRFQYNFDGIQTQLRSQRAYDASRQRAREEAYREGREGAAEQGAVLGKILALQHRRAHARSGAPLPSAGGLDVENELRRAGISSAALRPRRNLSEPNMEREFDEETAGIMTWLKNRQWEDGAWGDISAQASLNWNLSYMYRHKFDRQSVFGEFQFVKDDDTAWSLWLHRQVAGAHQQAVEYFEGLDRFANSSDAKNHYRSQFKRTYRMVINEKWYDAVMVRDDQAMDYGMQVGSRVIERVAAAQGSYDGYLGDFASQAARGFNEAIMASTLDSYESADQVYASSMVIDDDFRLRLRPAKAVQNTFFAEKSGEDVFPSEAGVGSSLDAVLGHLTNLGDANGELVVKERSAAQSRTIPIGFAAATSEEGRIFVAPDLARVGADAPPNTDHEATIAVGQYQRKVAIRISWAQTIRNYVALGKDHKSGIGKLIFDYLAENMKKDWYRHWNDDDAKGNEYVETARNPDNLAVQWAKTLKSLAPEERAKLALLKDDLIEGLGGEPGWMRASITKQRYSDLVSLLGKSFQ